MTITENFHTVRLLEEFNEVHFTCGGFWNPEVMRGFFAELNAATLPLVKAGKSMYALGDFSEAMPQDRETAEIIAEHLRNAIKFGLKRVAIINATALMKIQYKRVSQGLEVEFFESKAAALDWLRKDR